MPAGIYGRAALEVLRHVVAGAKDGDPLAPVTVVVPSNHVGVSARRLLAGGRLGEVAAGGSGVAAVTFLTTYRLAELLGAATLAGAGRRPVSNPVISAAIRRALADDAGMFAPVAGHAATEAALVASRSRGGISRPPLGAHRRHRSSGEGDRLQVVLDAELEEDRRSRGCSDGDLDQQATQELEAVGSAIECDPRLEAQRPAPLVDLDRHLLRADALESEGGDSCEHSPPR